jgi:hypothetical protein
VSCVRDRVKMTRPLSTTLAAGAAAGAAACALLGGCTSTAAQAPDLSGIGANDGAGPGYQDTRITLPETVDLSFPRVPKTDRIEHEVLFTVQQALRAQLHAEYTAATPTDPLLAVYWSGSALASAQGEIAAWTKKGEQPVGMLVITNPAYTAPNPSGVAAVSYCASWADAPTATVTATAEASAPVVAEPVQATAAPTGTFTTLSLTRTGGHRWQIMTLDAAAGSARCTK